MTLPPPGRSRFAMTAARDDGRRHGKGPGFPNRVKKSGFIYDELVLHPQTGPHSPETPYRLEAVAKRIAATGLKRSLAHFTPVTDRHVITQAILAGHSQTHYDSVA